MSAILTATDLEVRHNQHIVLDRASLTIDEHARIGLVGRNGAGKSTFLRIASGSMKPDAGELTGRRGLMVGYLPQESVLDPGRTVEENVRSGARLVLDLIAEFESLPVTSKRHEELEQRIVMLDGWNLDHRIATAMAQLHCPDPQRDVAALSGGERRRVALCRAIISRPDLLLLDEPTNHLDTDSTEWLADYLENYPAAFLLVTHDRYFLDRVTNSIVELAGGKFYSYDGNYTEYLVAKAERQGIEENLEHKRQMFLRRELDWVRRGPPARTTKSKSRLDRYFEVAGQAAPELERDVDLVIPPPPPLGNRTVELFNVGMELGGRTLFSHLNHSFTAGQRIGITGRNGLGKTTLLRVILGELPPTSGEVKIGQLTRFNYIDQGRLQLSEEKTVLEELSDGSEFVLFGEQRLSIRAYLKRFLFTDDRIMTQVKYLSGGERSRLLLARILKRGGNFLILDEPTNDLDLPTLRIVEEALVAFPGVVVVVSHDRYFLNRVATGILAFEGAGVVRYNPGNYDYYAEIRARQLANAAPTKEVKQRTEQPVRASTNRPRKMSFKETKEWEGIEPAILQADENIARIEQMFAEPDFHRQFGHRLSELTMELAEEKARVANLYARWEELEKIRLGSLIKE